MLKYLDFSSAVSDHWSINTPLVFRIFAGAEVQGPSDVMEAAARIAEAQLAGQLGGAALGSKPRGATRSGTRSGARGVTTCNLSAPPTRVLQHI